MINFSYLYQRLFGSCSLTQEEFRFYYPMNVAGRVNIKAVCNTMKLNRAFLHSTIPLKVQEDKKEPVVLSQKVIKSGNNCTFMAMVLVKESCKYREPGLGLLPHLSERGVSTILKKQHHTLSCVTLKGEPG